MYGLGVRLALRYDYQHLGPLAAVRSPAWSPDGSLLAYIHHRDTVILNSDGKELHRISFPFLDECIDDSPFHSIVMPAVWSNDGQRIAISVISPCNEGQGVVFTVRPDGSDLRTIVNLTGGVTDLTTAAWEQDDSRLYFAAGRKTEEHAVLYAVENDGTNRQAIATLVGKGYDEVKMSPSGKELMLLFRSLYSRAYDQSSREVTWDFDLTGLYLIDVDGTDLRQIYSGVPYASWSPDGNRIAVRELTEAPPVNLLFIIYPNGEPGPVLIKRDAYGALVSGQNARP